ncbi:MAG: hypothetical protein GTO14_15080 [Anaerolineales bacterium]|nr:hypothetical protein [Anaerolineales bacterium]
MINMHYLRLVSDHDVRAPQDSFKASDFIPPVYVEEGAVIGRNCTIGPFVYIESGSHIGEGSALSEAVILSGACLPPGSVVHHQVRYE